MVPPRTKRAWAANTEGEVDPLAWHTAALDPKGQHLATKHHSGFRLDVPFLSGKRCCLTGEFARAGGDVSHAAFDNGAPAPGLFTQHLFGMRAGSIY